MPWTRSTRRLGMRELGPRLRSWEGMLLAILLVVVALNALAAPGYLTVQNQVNLFELSVEKAHRRPGHDVRHHQRRDRPVRRLGHGPVRGRRGRACRARAFRPRSRSSSPWRSAACAGLLNGFWIAIVGLPSLAVTLAGLIGYRGLARVLIEDRSVGGFPDWFEDLGQQPILGPLPLALIIFAVMVVGATIILSRSGFGRYVYVLGQQHPGRAILGRSDVRGSGSRSSRRAG